MYSLLSYAHIFAHVRAHAHSCTTMTPVNATQGEAKVRQVRAELQLQTDEANERATEAQRKTDEEHQTVLRLRCELDAYTSDRQG
jgi:hypothetical protein